MAIERDINCLKNSFLMFYNSLKHNVPDWRRKEIEDLLLCMGFEDWEIQEDWNKNG